jgi:hypothetical protein
MCVVGIFCLIKLERVQMKAGGTRPTEPKKFLFSYNAFVHSKQTPFLAVVAGAELTRNRSQLATLG